MMSTVMPDPTGTVILLSLWCSGHHWEQDYCHLHKLPLVLVCKPPDIFETKYLINVLSMTLLTCLFHGLASLHSETYKKYTSKSKIALGCQHLTFHKICTGLSQFPNMVFSHFYSSPSQGFKRKQTSASID